MRLALDLVIRRNLAVAAFLALVAVGCAPKRLVATLRD